MKVQAYTRVNVIDTGQWLLMSRVSSSTGTSDPWLPVHECDTETFTQSSQNNKNSFMMMGLEYVNRCSSEMIIVTD